jgi:hypothetical protein
MAQYNLHCFSQSGNSYRVARALACTGLVHLGRQSSWGEFSERIRWRTPTPHLR